MERTINFGLVLPEYSGPIVSVGRTEISLSIGQNCCPQYRSFVSCLQNNNQTRSGLGRVCITGMYCPIGHVLFPKFLLNGKRP